MLVTLLAWSSNAAAKTTSWAQAELRAVVAAGLMAKEAAARPDWLYMQVDGSREVDQEVLKEFRKKFLR